VYFIDNDDYFMKRQMALDESGMPYSDNGQRAIFFARGVLETVKKLRWNPDIIHCQGWMAAYIPVLIKKAFKDEPAFANTKVVTTLFNHGLEGQLGHNFKKTLEYKSIKAATLSEFNAEFDYNELEKLAIAFSDGVIEGGEGIKQQLLDYADKKGVPVLKYPGQDFTESYKKFYDTVYPEK
jgi:starch synthase